MKQYVVHGAAGTGSVAVEAALTLIGAPYSVEKPVGRTPPFGGPFTPVGQVPAQLRHVDVWHDGPLQHALGCGGEHAGQAIVDAFAGAILGKQRRYRRLQIVMGIHSVAAGEFQPIDAASA